MSYIEDLKNTPDPPWTLLNTTPLPPHLQFRSVKTRFARSSGSTKGKKAPGPDGVTPACLQSCADQLAPIFTKILNRSLELCKVPSNIKCCTIIPIPNKPQITALNVYWSVALSLSQVYRSKSFEKLVLAHLKDITGPSLDPLQFADRTNRSVDDEVNMGLHYVLQHLDRPGAYVRVLFVDFSSTFNTIIPNLLLPKLTQVYVPTSICQWINSFLTDRQQLLRLGKSNPTPVRSALELFMAVFSPHCSSPCTRMTEPLKTPLSSSWSLQTTPHWSASSRMVTSLLTDRKLRSWLPGAVLTTWSWTRSKQWRWSRTSGEPPLLSPHLPSWTALWLKWSHSDSWAPPSPRNWSGTLT